MTYRLLIVIPDRLTDIIIKGEITGNYYNPGQLFDEVHILMTNDDRPNPKDVQIMVGRAQLHLHNLPPPSPIKTLAWQPRFLRRWAQKGVELARQITPDIIRTHGNNLNGFLAAQIKKDLGIPLLTSLHINPDEDFRGRQNFWSDPRYFIFAWVSIALEKETLDNADLVMPVYEPIREYAIRRGARNIRVCYNMLNTEHLRSKKNYALHNPPRIICVGRQFKEKNPENLIKAVARMDAHLTMVGNGTSHDHLKQVAQACGIQDRVTFYPAMPNDELCAILPDFDIFATHSEYWEISKSVLESLLTGLPLIINQRLGKPVPELQGDWVKLVKNTSEDYYRALQELITNDTEREALGLRAFKHAQQRYAPAQSETIFANIYRSYLNQ